MRRLIQFLLPLGAAACANQPMDYIPQSERTMLQAEAHLGNDPAAARGRISVPDMLLQARGAAEGADPSRLVLHFARSGTVPDDAQKRALNAFAAASRGQPVQVIARKQTPGEDPRLLTQRRAIAVANTLTATLPDVSIVFAVTPDADEIIVMRRPPGTEQNS